jgi:hypothetical protein
MKWLVIFWFSFTLYGGVCPLTQTGSSVFGPGGQGYIDWHGFIPGTSTSTFRQNITNASVDPRSATWLTYNQNTGQGIVLQNPQFQSDAFGEPWLGQVIHYVHGNAQRRMPVQGGVNGVDPGTMPVPNKPRIESYYGPFSRPQVGGQPPYFIAPGFYLMRNNGPSDAQMTIVDIDNCIEYDAYNCADNGAGIWCSNYGAYDMLAGDVQRPYAQGDVSNTSSVSGLPHMNGRLGWDEWIASNGIQHAIGVTMMNGVSAETPAFTGAATYAQSPGGTTTWSTDHIPFGSKIRLKASFDPVANGVPADCMPLITVLKTYGAIFYDGGLTANTASQETNNHWPWDCPSVAGGAMLFSPANAEVVVQSQSKIYCLPGYTGCPDALPTGNAPTISRFAINSGSSATVTLSGAQQALLLSWSVSGVVDLDGNPVRLRYISWGPKNRFGPGPIDGPGHDENINVTVCSSNACDIQTAGTYTIQLMVQNRFGRSTATVTLSVR